MKSEVSAHGDEKGSYIVASISVFGHIMVDDSKNISKTAKRIRFLMNKISVEWTDENKTKMKVWAKIFGFVSFEMKTETSKTH